MKRIFIYPEGNSKSKWKLSWRYDAWAESWIKQGFDQQIQSELYMNSLRNKSTEWDLEMAKRLLSLMSKGEVWRDRQEKVWDGEKSDLSCQGFGLYPV